MSDSTPPTDKPQRGARFEHARLITGSPKAGTARPVVCTVTAVRAGTVYYRTADGAKLRSDLAKFPEVVGKWLRDDREEALAAVADLSDESVHRKRLAAIADALNADPPATWNQIGAALGQAGSNAHRKYMPQLEEAGRRQYRVKPDTASKE